MFVKVKSICPFSFILCSALMLLMELPALAVPGAKLTWSPSTDPNVAGYKIYYGTVSHDYTNVVDVGNTTNTTVYGLQTGTTYYFAATTYDASGNESDFSNEATYVISAPPVSLTSPSHVAGQFSFAVSGVAGTQYVVQASTNLVDWVSVQTNTAPFNFVDANAGNYSQRFYRTVTLQ